MSEGKKNFYCRARGPAVMAALCLIAVSLMAPAASAYDTPETTWTQTGTGFGGVYPGVNAYKSATVAYFGASWSDQRDVWECNFRIASPGETRWSEDGSAIDTIYLQRVVVSETSNKAHQAMWTSTDSKYLGGWPESGTPPGVYFDVAYSATSLAVGAINPYAGFALGVGDLLMALVNTCDSQQNGETVIREWYYNNHESDVFHWFYWLNDVDAGQEVQFSVSDEMYGPGWEYVGVSWNIDINAPPVPSQMSAAELESYGIEIIPADQLESRASELNMAPETLKDLKASGKPVYYAHKIPVTVTETKPQPDSSKVSPEFLASYAS